ncbi:unnamed protein product, partial [Cladocopium goreaui]
MDVADLQLPLDEVAETDVAEQQLSPVDGEVLADDSCPAHRFAFLTQKAINQLLVSVLQSKSDEELHGLKIATVLEDVLTTSGGKVTAEELADKRDDFIAAAMKQVPRELARRLVSTVQAKSKSEEMDEVQVVQIDSRTWQKAYLITVSGLSPTEAPTREELQRTMLKAFAAAEYSEGKDIHLWPIITALKLTDSVMLCRQLEDCDSIIQAGEQSVWQKFTSCLTAPCVCGRDWVSAARQILRVNRIDEKQVTDDIKRCLLKGLHTKGQVLTFAGYGNEGKSFLLRPLAEIYRASQHEFSECVSSRLS